jgi:cob(I)alamin adenosyltransferase
MSITTKFGDAGSTHICCGEVVLKNSDRVKATGDVDALVTYLGVAKAKIYEWADSDYLALKEELAYIQRMLFIVGSEVACNVQNLHKLKKRIDADDMAYLDARRDELESRIQLPKDFILPGSNPISADIDLCRVYCRALERTIVQLSTNQMIQSEFLLKWVNRLSDYLYLLARSTELNNYTVR